MSVRGQRYPTEEVPRDDAGLRRRTRPGPADPRGEGVADVRLRLLAHAGASSARASPRSWSRTARTVCASRPRTPTTWASATPCRPPASRPPPRSARRGTSSWCTRVGEALGRETRANDVAVLLGPGREHQADPAVRPQLRVRRPRTPWSPGSWAPRSCGASRARASGRRSSTSRRTTRSPTACACPPTSTSARCARSTCRRSSGW